MASTTSVWLCALVGLATWTGIGWLFARRLALPRALALPFAPALGWAVQSAIALMLADAVGLSVATIVASVLLAIAAARWLPGGSRQRSPAADEDRSPRAWFYLLAAILAIAPAAAVMPKQVDDGVILAAPIFDHSKIALIDQMIREGVPPANPVFGHDGADAPSSGVAYYYLWHFAAAETALATNASGWEADIASSWFTAFATLCLMGGLAVQWSRRSWAPAFVLVASATGSVRPVLALLFGASSVDRVIEEATGLAGWLFQSSWSPHHVASAACSVIAAVLIARIAARPSMLAVVTLALVMAAGFESSIWVGGFAFAIAATMLALTQWPGMPRGSRLRFVGLLVVAAFGAAAIASPLLVEQAHAAAVRGGGSPIALAPAYVLGPFLPETIRRILDVPAYWLILLVVELPVVFVAGSIVLASRVGASREPDHDRLSLNRALAVLAFTSLCCSWMLVSTAGINNDLGWRAVLPGVLILTAAAAAGFAAWLAQGRRAILLAGAICVALAAPDGARLVGANLRGKPSASAATFTQAPAMWAAVRRHTAADARVANNPLLLGDLTPWPVNIAWALLADRRSCFAGPELAIAFANLPTAQREAIAAQFVRVFDGQPIDGDVHALAHDYGCDAVVVTSGDGAWTRDPFMDSPDYALAETQDARWRIYLSRHAKATTR